MSTAPRSLRLHALEIRSEHDVVLCRQRARQYAEGLGFHPQDQTRIATAVSEIARNAYQYAGRGRVEFSVVTRLHPSGDIRQGQQSLLIKVQDEGTGIKDLEGVLAGRVVSSTGLGVGIIGTRRLMDSVEFNSGPQGTTVVLEKALLGGARWLSPAEIQGMVDVIARKPPSNALEDVQQQNQELIRLMEEVQKRREELDEANRELAETNAGVLALYDELETLHRVGLLLAAKVDLNELIMALMDATTELTGAQWGTFFFCDDTHVWKAFATSGEKRYLLQEFASQPHRITVADFGPKGLLNLAHGAPSNPGDPLEAFVVELHGATALESLLVVPVPDRNGMLAGVIVLGNSMPVGFSERVERIVASIAVQAAVAVEKARLFESVRSASDAKDRFLAMLSHELRTPLNPVMAIVSSILEDALLPASHREDLEVVLRNVKLETRLIDDLLDFHRLINGKIEIVRHPVEIHEVLQSVLQICRVDLVERKQRLVLSFRAEHSTVSGEMARIQQIFWNLLKNAIKFTPVEGTIEIATECTPDAVIQISFKDTGRGILPAELPHVFAAFEQGDSRTAQEFGGLGLGLAIARTFVEKHGGTITVSSEGRGKGACFTISLPLTVASESEIAPPAGGNAPDPTATVRILLVDDHADTLVTLARLLGRVGHNVVSAKNGAEALSVFKQHEFDLVISDLGLPDCTGFELIAKIRETSQVPALAMSGYGMETDIVKSMNAGFNEHLTKPVELKALTAKISKLAGRDVITRRKGPPSPET